MAVFSNQATLSYNGITTQSNIAYGDLLETLTVTKNAVEASYSPDGTVTYAVTLRNTGTTPLTNVTITDDLGGYPFGTGTVYPLAYAPNSVVVLTDGVRQADPAVTAGPPLVISGITVPAGGSATVLYQTQVTAFADPGTDGAITNTATVTADGLNAPVIAEATVPSTDGTSLTITKAITPEQVSDNDRVTYTFTLRNFGTEPLVATDNAVITDTFDPILTGLTVAYNGTPWTQGIQYNYNAGTGLFTTVPANLTVPAATYTQNPATGAYTVIPGTATLTVTGTI